MVRNCCLNVLDFVFADLRMRHLRQEVPDGQDIGGPLQGRPLEQQAFRVHTLRLQGRTEGFFGNITVLFKQILLI